MSDGIGSMNFESIQSTLNSNIKRSESAIEKATSDPNFGKELGSTLRLNFDLARLNVMVSSAANVIKEIGETMKGVVQKAA